MIGIYKITNKINNKSYIGQSVNISKRWYEHLNKRGNPNLPLYKDFDKYGSDNFTFTILEHCKKEELNEKEIYYIKFYNSLIPNGYNLQKGGRSKGYEIYFLFSKEDIDNIYSLLRENKLTFNEIAEKYNVSNTLIRYINEGIEYPQDDIQYPIRSREDSHKIHYTNLKNKLCGEQSYRATITEETAKKIIFDLENNLELKIVDIAKKYNTTIDVVKDINRFKSWKHIERKKPCREDLGNNVLLPDEVKDIKILLKNPKIKYSDIMKKYPLATYYIINKINKGET